jgi:hypothetical protein
MNEMFYNAESFCQDLSSWKLNSIVKRQNMFKGAKSFQNQYDVKNLQKKHDLVTLNTEEKKIITKIKKLIISRDYGLINAGIELLRSIDNTFIYEYFLHGNLINEEGYLITSKLFSGTNPAQPYHDYALISLINYAPNEINILPSIIKSNIKTLYLIAPLSEVKRVQINYSWEEIVTDDCGKFSVDKLPIFEFENLEELTIVNYLELKSLDFLSKCKNLKKLNLKLCNSISDLDALNEHNSLISVKIERCHNLKNFDGIKNHKNLDIIHL